MGDAEDGEMNTSRGFRVLAGVLAASLLTSCATLRQPGDEWIANDKADHFVAFGLMGAAAALAAAHNDRPDGETFLVGVGVATGLGVGKEVIDDKARHKYFSGKDLVWDVLGGVFCSLVVIGAD